MAALEELIQQISDEQLRQKISAEVTNLKRRTKFGLVFENHTPECLALYDVPIRKNSVIAKKFSALKEFYRVVDIKNDIANCIDKDGQHFEFALSEIVTVARFGDSIYPYLEPLDSISRAPDSDLWHILIEAENYHALQLLKYVCEDRKVDCIYIDPPYNTGARDWKYNNEYVDTSDGYRHSKWLSMMERRLKLAKDILNPNDSVLIITIDEHEYLHLGGLLENMFRGSRIQMISSVINPAGAGRQNDFARTDEYIFFIQFGNSSVLPETRNLEDVPIIWDTLRRSNIKNTRDKTNKQFYPIYVDKNTGRISEIGDPIPKEVSIKDLPEKDGCISVFPIRDNGVEMMWGCSPEELRKRLADGFVRAGKFTLDKPQKCVISYVTSGIIEDIKNGKAIVDGRNEDGSIKAHYPKGRDKMPTTNWNRPSHDAQRYGNNLLKSIIGARFSYPKSLYAVRDCLNFFLANKPNALILDFFAGSGTTMHAVNLLNAEDGGNRRCILVTNNEVSEAESKALKKAGHQPGDEAWNKLGIARYVTWPRNVCAIKGENLNGEPLSGKYLGSEIEMSEGFKANASFFKLDFLNKDAVELGREFKRLLPLLWLKAGGYGECPKVDSENLPTMMILPKNKLAFLLDESFFYEFKHEIYSTPEIKTVFIISDTHYGFNAMAADLPDQKVIQLYKNYLVDFRLFIKG